MKTAVLPRTRILSVNFSWLILLLCHPLAVAADNDVVLIEEYWELQVGGPDVSRTAPQVTMFMSPTDSLGQDYFAFAVNHWSFPDFAGGGYQLQRWHNENCEQSLNGIKFNSLSTDGEVVSWVQRLSLQEGNLRFQVFDGHGDSWDNFGGEGFWISIASSLDKLNGYRPAISLTQSGIGFAGNRVSSLTLTKLRWKTADGEYHEMVAPIDIDADLDP